MNLEIIVRTHNKSNVHTDRQRYIKVDKTSLIIGCLSSLIKSTNNINNHNISYVILDDNSTDDFFVKLEEIFLKSKFPYKLIRLEKNGFNYSALKQFEFCKDSNADLVYSVEDDYLHCPSAIEEMLECYTLFKEKSGKDIVIYPFDMPDDYVPPWMEPCYVVHGSKRHWKTGSWTTNTLLTTPQLFQKHWHYFEKLAKEYSPIKHEVHEGNTIVNIYKNHALRFSPIPSLALHMQFDQQKDPYIDWEFWWNNYAKL